MFRKVMREPPVGQVAFTFTILGFINASLIWPVCLALYFSGTESMPWERDSWIILLIASVLMLGKCEKVSCLFVSVHQISFLHQHTLVDKKTQNNFVLHA